MLGQYLKQQPQTCRIVADAALGNQLPMVIDQADVVVALRPINPAEHRQRSASLLLDQPRSEPAQGTRAALMEGLDGPTPDQPFMAPTRRRGLGLRLSGHRRASVRRGGTLRPAQAVIMTRSGAFTRAARRRTDL
jgi:hypothetical protein